MPSPIPALRAERLRAPYERMSTGRLRLLQLLFLVTAIYHLTLMDRFWPGEAHLGIPAGWWLASWCSGIVALSGSWLMTTSELRRRRRNGHSS